MEGAMGGGGNNGGEAWLRGDIEEERRMGGKAPGTSWECSLELTFCYYCVLRASAQVECF